MQQQPASSALWAGTDYAKNHQHLAELLAGRTDRKLMVRGYMDLFIEQISENEIFLAHYAEQRGDLMRDPEVVFQLTVNGGVPLALPVYFRNDFAGVEHWTVDYPGTDVEVRPGAQRGLNDFVRMWFANLRDQGFFDPAQVLEEPRGI